MHKRIWMFILVSLTACIGCSSPPDSQQSSGLDAPAGWCGHDGDPCQEIKDGQVLWDGTCRFSDSWECCGGCWTGERCAGGEDPYGCGMGGEDCTPWPCSN